MSGVVTIVPLGLIMVLPPPLTPEASAVSGASDISVGLSTLVNSVVSGTQAFFTGSNVYPVGQVSAL